ncbi:NADH-quinone oxidoreductase subunit L [Cerasicoccus arenae]|uniref:NADH-quinone oxidoreductase subunit L n=1 Tax=Cerasicoccus arenae TaxID=424488 RepID=A0A8J3DKY1_9BACT|nr:NADH-quinone oxidoreductase subunit L [Cerasicoccus arenae]MBK1856633.1 NADH-quinone oxidoreductase subunit L [Cerasicoccus arenae]GHC12331.1 NADH-quinone oxidoreductase subunit L [Cerasicoccus arenae]
MDTLALFNILLFIPLVSAGIIALFLRRGGIVAAGVSVLAALGIAVVSFMILFGWNGEPLGGDHYSYTWLEFGTYQINLGYYFTYESATMLAVVAFVGFFIHVFSVGYMDDDQNKGRFFGGLSIFMFSMLGIVLASNLFMIFIFWELVGFSSYMLIAHYWDKDFAAAASKKAFIVNRIGDFGFLVGIAWAYHYFGTADFAEINALIASGEKHAVTGIGLLLMCGFLGKSAQFPLQVWLTDAMAGPTPVSALIHAATMVAAGVYFMVRIFFLLTPDVLEVIMWICAAMAMLAGFWALGQSDIKKSLAYSTLSHLGYMGTALGLGFPGLAIMHMAMHACFKATLFLCSGSVIHACHHEQDMFKMGGLWKKMPITGTAFLFATLSIAAVPMFAGYYSKDTIIGAAFGVGAETGNSAYYGVWALVLIAALTTSLYMGRMFYVVFLGKPNSEKAEHAHESNLWMTVPLIVLGIFLSLGAGWFASSTLDFKWANGEMTAMLPTDATTFMMDGYDVAEDGSHAGDTAHHVDKPHHGYGGGFTAAHHAIDASGQKTMLEGSSFAMMLLGFIFTFFYYGLGPSKDKLQTQLPGLYNALAKHGWFDDIYDWYVAEVQERFANILATLDQLLISGLLVRGTAGVAGLFGMVSRSLHVGNIHGYVYWFLAGVLFFGAFALGML